jgi:hypothetical protein
MNKLCLIDKFKNEIKIILKIIDPLPILVVFFDQQYNIIYTNKHFKNKISNNDNKVIFI